MGLIQEPQYHLENLLVKLLSSIYKEYKLEGRHWKKEKAFQRAKRRRETEREREEKKLEKIATTTTSR